jgi:dienelactone hydrolase
MIAYYKIFQLYVMMGCCFFLTGHPAPDLQNTSNKRLANPAASIKTETIEYISGNKHCRGYIAYDENIKGKRPIVIIVHEWWGLNNYAKSRARQIAGLGYFAFVADLFGEGQLANNPDEARAFTRPYYTHPENTLQPIEDAITQAGGFAQADTSKTAAIGYCFGGFVVVNAAKEGAPLKGVVSFHGRLVGVGFQKHLIKAKVLICQGGDDEFAPLSDQTAFKKSMDSIGADYTFFSYPGAKHAYSNPESTELGRKFNMPMAYNAAADSASWKDMQSFFISVFN